MISIIILNYNKAILLKNCINSIINCKSTNYEIIIVDNGSTDAFVPRDNQTNFKYIELESNFGFSKAVNIGIKQAKGEYIAILNNDTEVDPRWLKNVITAFTQNRDAMVITSKIRSLHDKELLDNVGDIILLSGKVYKIGNNEKDIGQYDKQRYIFGANGCASVFRKEFFDKVGYFDENFFAYLEDIDLSFRANLLGYKCLYIPDAIVYHVGSATTGSQYNDFTVFHLAQNTISVLVKNLPTKILIRSILPMLTYITSLQAFFLIKGLGGAYFRGLVSGIRLISKMLPKRYGIIGTRVLTDDEIIRMFRENKKLYKISKKNRNKK